MAIQLTQTQQQVQSGLPRIPWPAVLSVVSMLLSPFAVAEQKQHPSWLVSGFAQLRADWVEDDGRADFGADRIRAGVQYQADRYFAKLLLDFNANNGGQRVGSTLPKMVQDAFVGYRFSDHADIRLGQFKTPLGMDFNTPGTKLDIAKRGMEKPLALERDSGVMLSVRKIHGFGFDAGLFNPADRSGAVNAKPASGSETQGRAHAFAARLLWDRGPWHAQASVGGSQQAGGLGSADYEVFDAGLRWQAENTTLKGEIIRGKNVLGVRKRNEQVWYAHAGYRLSPQHELVIRHYSGRNEGINQSPHRLGNTFLGWSYWPRSEQPAQLRLQVNYLFASGDTEQYSGLGGFRSDAVFVQLQIKAR